MYHSSLNSSPTFSIEIEPSKFSFITSFSSSSSYSSSDDDEEISSLVALYEANNAAMVEILREGVEQPNKHRGSFSSSSSYSSSVAKEEGNQLFADYFIEDPIYPPSMFQRRFRMTRDLFMRILDAIEAHNPYFVQKIYACHVIGLSPLQKMTSSIRMFAYGMSADAVDDYVRIGESTPILSLKMFCQSVIKVIGGEYLRSPTEDDIARLLAVGEAHGFPGMLGSLDCMHWQWKNCLTTWQGQYCDHVKNPTIILEGVASYDLWIWHAFLMSGSHNDINVLDRSPLFSELMQGRAPPCNYSINGHNYNMRYYLADGIYPPWATLVQTISSPQGEKKQKFSMMLESTRKDMERAFGVLFVCGPARFWDPKTLGDIMKTCIILHNMIVENERGGYNNFDYEISENSQPAAISRECTNDFESFMAHHVRIRDVNVYHALRNDLVEHTWQRRGGM